jgi:LysM repeat protein
MPTADQQPPRLARRAARAVAVVVLLALVAGAAAGSTIRIRRGDTLWELARRYHTSVAALRSLNHIGGNNVIYVGQLLTVPGARAVAPSHRPTARKPAHRHAPARVRVSYADTRYSVRSGDNLSRLGRRFGSTVAWLVVRNHLRTTIIQVGQALVVTTTKRVVTPARARATSRAVRLGLHAVPVRTVIRLLRREARLNHIDPNLVLGLATQESGLRQNVVSRVGAIGVMQVMPYTADWAGRYLIRHRVDIRRVEDNIVVGTRFLTFLIRLAGVHDGLAGYYQGLTSVRQRGLFDDTRAYVRNILALRRRFAAGRAR